MLLGVGSFLHELVFFEGNPYGEDKDDVLFEFEEKVVGAHFLQFAKQVVAFFQHLGGEDVRLEIVGDHGQETLVGFYLAEEVFMLLNII